MIDNFGHAYILGGDWMALALVPFYSLFSQSVHNELQRRIFTT